MKGIGIVAALVLLFAPGVSAQQDPRDPGIQDSLILVCLNDRVDSVNTYQYRTMLVYAVTDDSVAFYNVPIRWNAPGGGVWIDVGTQYFPPINQWAEHYDSVVAGQDYIRQFGWADFDSLDTPLLITGSVRLIAWTLHVVIAPNTPSQIVSFDTCYDAFTGPLLLGLWGGRSEFVPAFQPGYLVIDPGSAVGEGTLPMVFSLSQNYPNPFNPTTTIEFSVASRGRVTLEVFNLLGQRVRVLADGIYEPGRYTVAWDGADQRGNPVSSGAYFYRLNANGFDQMKRMVLLK